MVTLEDVLHVLEQKDFIDVRVRMAKILLKEMIEQKGEVNEDTNKIHNRQAHIHS